ncbi:uncharacterized protein FMAN_14134 [Fusarium mangiferae]|uniref:Uncharacterized protein n=1 Tax=Fusarium mangiferae TaxID=192010 RepID=A0A1L7UCW2_FUSMA|nr:uncharacterized protein FMAN_14134 [Fusarium mangiferae]CVL08249.1 uncharacterized protein FMAN_14134 [Fusarium mangiferae]
MVSARNPHWRPGFWDAGTARVIMTHVTNISSAYILRSYLVKLSYVRAIRVNVGSILLVTIATHVSCKAVAVLFFLLSFLTNTAWLLPTWTHLNALLGPLVSFLGGGSHASKFLTLAVIHSRNTSCARTMYYYITGFITVLAQVLGPILANRESPWFALPILTAAVIAMFLDGTDNGSLELGQDESGSVTHPLFSRSRYSDDGAASLVELLTMCLGLKAPGRHKLLVFTSRISFFIAIPQASRPLFATYAQQRCSLGPTEADNLWLLRSEISMVIFGVLLPCLIFIKGYTGQFSNSINLTIGKCSVILMALGAIVIGLSHSSLAITIGSCFLDLLNNVLNNNEGLIINTFGVSSNLSLLCFAANRLSSSAVGLVLMSVALFESVGLLIGITITYPIYQWSIDDKTPFYAGSLLYVLCGVSVSLSHTSISSYAYCKTKSIYACIAVVVWRIFRESH